MAKELQGDLPLWVILDGLEEMDQIVRHLNKDRLVSNVKNPSEHHVAG